MGATTNLTRMWFTRTIQLFTFKREHDRLLPLAKCENLGLYVHIPFCKSICNPCSYCKVPYPAPPCNHYIDVLIQEIYLIDRQHKGRKKVTNLYFGGGTPAFAANRIKEIASALNEHSIITEGIGLGLHPGDVRVELLQTLKDAGVMKISIGVQSFSDKYQKLFGRRKIDTVALAAALAAVPSETVSMDFISAPPGRRYNDLKSDIDLAFSPGASHIATYPLIDFTFTENSASAIPKKKKRALLDAITNYCFKRGYSYNSTWTFSSEVVSNYSSMTRDNSPGFGRPATSLFKRQFKINTLDPDVYCKRIHSRKPAASPMLRFIRRQRMTYWPFWTTHSIKIRAADFQAFFGVPLKEIYNFEFWFAKQFGFLTEHKGGYEMTLKGVFYYHYYENFYTLSYIDKMWGIIRKEVFPEETKL